jgi:hypothetical protein
LIGLVKGECGVVNHILDRAYLSGIGCAVYARLGVRGEVLRLHTGYNGATEACLAVLVRPFPGTKNCVSCNHVRSTPFPEVTPRYQRRGWSPGPPPGIPNLAWVASDFLANHRETSAGTARTLLLIALNVPERNFITPFRSKSISKALLAMCPMGSS